MLQVWLLGQFEVRVDGKRAVIPSRAGQSLLAFLIVTAGTMHRREKLAGMLWPERSEDNARHNFRQHLWRVRKSITPPSSTPGEYILSEEFTIGFNPNADYWLDVAQLQLLPQNFSTEERVRQVGLYRGEFLPGFYDEWVGLERERIAVVFDRRMQELLEQLIVERQWQHVVEWSQRWIALGATPEPAYRALMRAYAALGEFSQVARAYEHCAQALRSDLGVEPSAETLSLLGELFHSKQDTQPILLTIQETPADFPLLKLPYTGNEPPAPGEPPFKGLEFFDEADAGLFFGREPLVASLVGDLRQNCFLAVVVGASGSGKSSIVRAGLIPALRRGELLADGTLPPEGSRDWDVYVMTPTAHPLEALATCLTRESESVTATATLMDDLAREPRSLYLYLHRRLVSRPSLTTSGESSSSLQNLRTVTGHVLLVVDQFEELFTLCHSTFEREAFLDNLMDAVLLTDPADAGTGRSHSLTLVLALRADFYAHLAQYPELRDAVAANQKYIGPMTVEEMRRAIELPAQARCAADGAAWEFEPGVVDLILRDVGDEPGALPLLSHALLETWTRRSGHLLTLKGYHDAGGVRGAIAQTAETIFERLLPAQQTIARNLFLRLTELGKGTDDTRRRASYNEVIPQSQDGTEVRTVLTQLADARLVTTGKDSVEVAHEALIREWPRLREWLNEDREGLILHRHLTEAAHEWELMERDASVLFRGARLAQADEWSQLNPGMLNAHELAFLVASMENEKREEKERTEARERELMAKEQLLQAEQILVAQEQEANQRLHRRALILAGVMVVALLAAVAAAFLGSRATENAAVAQHNALVAEQNAQAAERQRRIATARELAASAKANLTVDSERSILLALQAVAGTGTDNTVIPEAVEALHTAVLASHVVATVNPRTVGTSSITYSPDIGVYATSSRDGTTQVWDSRTHQQRLVIPHQPGLAFNVVYSRDGKRMVTLDGGETLELKIWDVSLGKLLAATDMGTVFSDSEFDALDSHWTIPLLALTGGRMRIIDLERRKILLDVDDRDWRPFQSVASPNGKQRASTIGIGDRMVSVSDVTTGKQLFAFDYTDLVPTLGYSPDSARLAVGSYDGTISIWDTATGKELFHFAPHIGHINAVAWNADGSMLAAAGWDRTAIVWDTATGAEVARFYGQTDQMSGVTFTSEGNYLITSSNDGTIKVWSLAPDAEILTVPVHVGTGTVAYNPDGTRLLAGTQSSALVFDAATGRQLLKLTGQAGPIYASAFNPDGSKIATGDATGTVKIWQTSSGKELFTINAYPGIYAMKFSPDGSQLAVRGDRLTIHDVATGKELRSFSSNGFPNVAFNPDGSLLAGATGPGTTTIWHFPSGIAALTLNADPRSTVFDVQFSPDGKEIVTANENGTAQVWDVDTGKELLRLTGHDSEVFKSTFTPNGAQVVTASHDGTVKVWDATTGHELFAVPVHQGPFYDITMHPNGNHFAVSTEQAIYVLTLRTAELVTLAQSRLTRTWTTTECQTFLHIAQCPP